MKAKRTSYDVSAEKFALTWNTFLDIDKISQELSMPKDLVYARASNYRRAGVELKDLKPAKRKKMVDVHAINRLLREWEARHRQDTAAPEDAPASVTEAVQTFISSYQTAS